MIKNELEIIRVLKKAKLFNLTDVIQQSAIKLKFNLDTFYIKYVSQIQIYF